MDSQIVIDTNLLIAGGCLVLALGVVWAIVSSKRSNQQADLLDRIVLHQAELTGRLQAMGETQTGLARTIRPCHSPFDGDLVFAFSCGEHPADVLGVGQMAADVLAEAVLRAVRLADGFGLVPDVKSS